MSRQIHFVQIDAFARNAFEGNPAVVCKPGEALEADLMQSIAREMNVSETCFLVPRSEGYNLRWFTPRTEVDLCGHATLAAAYALWNEWGENAPDIVFESLSGRLTAKRSQELIWLDFPAERVDATQMPDRLAAAIPSTPIHVARNRLDFLVELVSEDEVRDLKPDLPMVASLENRGVIVTAVADRTEGADFVSRYFAPYFGIDEDPVTGSTHCALGPFWGERLGKSEVVGYQASERGGWVKVRVNEDRVALGGSAVLVARGTLSV